MLAIENVSPQKKGKTFIIDIILWCSKFQNFPKCFSLRLYPCRSFLLGNQGRARMNNVEETEENEGNTKQNLSEASCSQSTPDSRPFSYFFSEEGERLFYSTSGGGNILNE